MTTLRAGRVGDEEVLAKLNRFVQDLHVHHRPDHFREATLADVAAWYKSVLEKPTARVWIAEEDRKPAGYLLALFHNAPGNPFIHARAWLEIDQIAVDPAHRRRGIAGALIRQAIAEAKAEGIQSIEAAAWSFNEDMHEVMRRLGFAPKGIRFERLTSDK